MVMMIRTCMLLCAALCLAPVNSARIHRDATALLRQAKTAGDDDQSQVDPPALDEVPEESADSDADADADADAGADADDASDDTTTTAAATTPTTTTSTTTTTTTTTTTSTTITTTTTTTTSTTTSTTTTSTTTTSTTTTSTSTAAAACLLNRHAKQSREIGNKHAAPALYAEELGFKSCVNKPLDFDEWTNASGYSPMLLGGGELPHNIMSILSRHAGSVVFWGIGMPFFDGSEKSLPAYTRPENVKLIGTREYVNKGHHDVHSKVRWVPCASAMHHHFNDHFRKQPGVGALIFKSERTAERKVAYVKNDEGRVGSETHTTNCETHVKLFGFENGLEEADVTKSTNNTMGELIDFMAASDAVVSSSYHVLYWATLLGRKPIYCGEPAGLQRFKNTRWPVRAFSGNLSADVEQASSYPEAMQQARDANDRFAREVERVLQLQPMGI